MWISPTLFCNIFVDEFSLNLSSSNVGCHINSVCVKHLFYADDDVRIEPSALALQMLIFVSDCLLKKNEIMYNFKKPAYFTKVHERHKCS